MALNQRKSIRQKETWTKSELKSLKGYYLQGLKVSKIAILLFRTADFGAGKWIFGRNFYPGGIKGVAFYIGGMNSLINGIQGKKYAGTDFALATIGFLTPIPVISYTTFSSVNEKYN